MTIKLEKDDWQRLACTLEELKKINERYHEVFPGSPLPDPTQPPVPEKDDEYR